MHFTQEDYIKIENWLHRNSVKDTEFQEALPFTGKEIVTVVQDGHNRKVNIQEFINQLYKHGVEDFLNVTNTYKANNITLKEAIRLIPAEARKEGQVITFLNTDGNWEIYQFIGKLNQWNNPTLWNNPFDWEKFVVDSILPDEEDLTKSAPDSKGNSYLSLKDRKYEPDKYSGLGRKILRRRVVEIEDPIYGTQEKNLLLQADFTDENTIYEIRYDFDLNGSEITIPENCVLDFQGGSLNNGNIKGNNTDIKPSSNIFNNIFFSGTFKVSKVHTSWFFNYNDFDEIITQSQNISSYIVLDEDVVCKKQIQITKDCTLDFNNKTLQSENINILADNVVFNLNNGILKGFFNSGKVAETITNTNYFIAEEGHNFIVGEELHSSRLKDFFGHYSSNDPVIITNIEDNVITLNKHLTDVVLPKGLGLGNTSWTPIIDVKGKKFTIKNGIVQDSKAYYLSCNSDEGHIICDNIIFKNVGLDAFAVRNYSTLKINNCQIDKPLDYAKSCIMVVQGNIIVTNTTSKGGNVDYFIGNWYTKEADNYLNGGFYYIDNCIIDGKSAIEGIPNDLHAIGYHKDGYIDNITIKNSIFKNYERALLSSSSVKVEHDIKIKKININNCIFSSPILNFI